MRRDPDRDDRPGGARPVETLLLPGMDGTGDLFGPLAEHLEPELCPRVISLPPRRPLSYDALLDAIPAPDGPFFVVAESFSGPLGIRLAARYPDRLRALVLVASFARAPSRIAGWTGGAFGRWLFSQRPPDLALRAGLLGMDASADEVSALRAALDAVDPAVLAARARAIASIDVRELFAQSQAPVLYLAGRRDRVLSARVLAEMRRLRADMEVRVLDAPHLVLQRRPAEAARLISEFLGRSR
ncbi:MAG: alpha/beta hydrolase [Myxococcales bacterium]|nr:alpha/beta hydrolase [Myxococcales bacterium]